MQKIHVLGLFTKQVLTVPEHFLSRLPRLEGSTEQHSWASDMSPVASSGARAPERSQQDAETMAVKLGRNSIDTQDLGFSLLGRYKLTHVMSQNSKCD